MFKKIYHKIRHVLKGEDINSKLQKKRLSTSVCFSLSYRPDQIESFYVNIDMTTIHKLRTIYTLMQKTHLTVTLIYYF